MECLFKDLEKDIEDNTAMDRLVVECAVAFMDQLNSFNDITHPEVYKRVLDLQKAVAEYLMLKPSGGDVMPCNQHAYDISNAREIKVDLLGGRHTSFYLLHCECGHQLAFPPPNLALAIAEGTEGTKTYLRELGLI